MGKASSSKKVARAARAGGRVSSGQPRSLLFPGVISVVVVLGLALVVYAREDRRNDDLGSTPQIGEHIHQAIAFNVCGEFLPNPIPEFDAQIGIHTHGDGVLHVHPRSQLGVGANATLGRFLKDARNDGGLELDLSNSKLTYLGDDFTEGKTDCDGVDDPRLRVAYWANVQDPDSKPEVTTGDFGDLLLTEDGAGITVFYGDSKADIPRPPNADQLTELGAADGAPSASGADGATTSTTPAAGDTSSTVATEGDPTGSSTTAPADGSTTAPADSSTTVAP